MSGLGEVGVQARNLLRRWSWSRKLVIQAVPVREKENWRVRPLPSQQEEEMKAMKKLFGYLLEPRRVSISCVIFLEAQG